jgi:tRNA(fMet)-specific endonuclease VapC
VDYVIDTGFLIGRWRTGAAGAEQGFIERHADDTIAMPWIVKAEFMRGAAVAGHPIDAVQALLNRFPTLWVSETTLVRYVEIYADLVKRNQLIGPYDLWIAASALEYALPLLTRNGREFSRIPNLRIIDYTAAEAAGN